MLIVFIRTTILYILVICIIRLMGKRQIGELQPYELVVSIMISDLAALPMQDTRLPLILGIIPIITLLFLKTILTQIQVKFQSSRNFIDGEPCILIFKGKINYKALKKQQMDLDELLEQLRIEKIFNLEEVQYAILENSGKLSILPSNYNKQNSTSPTPPEVNLPKVLVEDGKINKSSLTSIGKDENWILNTLRKHNILSIKDVLIAMYDTAGKFQYQLYEDYRKECKK